jgi:hypothetical protein
VVLACRSYAEVGITWDEPPQLDNGNWVVSWYTSGFTDTRVIKGPISRYGGLFDGLASVAQHVSALGPYETKHLLTALMAVLGIVAAWKMAARLRDSRAGFIAASLLALTPAWIGHGMFNPKDIPFGTCVAWGFYALLLLVTGPMPVAWRTVLGCGLAIGAALGVRTIGMFLFGYFVVAALARVLLTRFTHEAASEQPLSRLLRQTAPRVVVGSALAWLIMLAAWPWAQHAPLSRPLRATLQAAHFVWNGKMLFRGEVLHSTALPGSYLPTWFAITLPDVYFVALGCGLFLLLRALGGGRPEVADSPSQPQTIPPLLRRFGVVCLVTTVAAPLLTASITRPALYDAHRHFLFILPGLAAVSGIALADFLGAAGLPAWLRTTTGVSCLGLLALTAIDVAQLHPYEYSYFNRSFGGLPRARGEFETDYWAVSYKEGVAWVVDNVPSTQAQRVRMCSCGTVAEINYYLAEAKASARFEVVKNAADADVFLAITREGCTRANGAIVHVVERQGVPLLYVIRRPHSSTTSTKDGA